MSCELIKEYNFCTITGKTVFAKEFTIDEATADWELEFKISSMKINETWNIEGGQLERVSDQTWRIKEYKEHLKPANYDFTMSYKFGTVDRVILKGKISVKHS